jgi:pimeloyl-ACP methyl ester carboxylesterase
MIEIDHQKIREYLDIIEASTTFASSSRLANFLRYIVEATLAGEAKRLNQLSIAIDIMGRHTEFDPTTDSCVRVEAGRLRAKMREYYDSEGAEDLIKFHLPKGRYNPDVKMSNSEALNEKKPELLKQTIRFCHTPDNVSIAYAESGRDKPVLVKAANWLSHLEHDCSSPIWNHWWKELSARFKLIRYDERGCGISDWDVGEFSFTSWVNDLTHVVDAAEVNRFALLGISQGAAVAIAYAVAHPEKVSHLILYGGFVQGRLQRHPPQMAEAKMLEELVTLGWGRSDPAFRRVFASLFSPDASTKELEEFDELQQASTSPANALRFIKLFNRIDVVELASKVKVPTLVLHSRDEAEVPVSQSRLIAAKIPDAKFVTLDSRNHILRTDEPAWKVFLEEVEKFVDVA